MYLKVEKYLYNNELKNDGTIKKLKDKQIHTLGELCRKTKISLINMKIDKKIVDDIEIQLQLIGLMLKGSL